MIYLIFLSLFISIDAIKLKSESFDVTKYGITREEMLKNPNYRDKVFNVPMSTEDGEELLEHWVVQGFSGVIAAIAMRRMSLVEEYQKNKHFTCSKAAETLSEHAKCLVQLDRHAHNNRLIHRRKYFTRKMRRRIDKLNPTVPIRADGWIGAFRNRAKRSIKLPYTLKSENDVTPFGLLTKHLANTVKLIKKKEKLGKWQETIERIAEKAKEVKQQRRIEKMMQQRVNAFTEAADMMQKEKREERIAKDDSLKELNDIEQYIDNEEIRDMIHSKVETMTEQEKMMLIPMRLMRQAAKLSLSMSGKNVTDFERKTIRMFSPRIMSVIPQDEEAKTNEIDVLSPSLFSLHDEGKGLEKSTSLGNLLGSLTDSKDSQAFLDLIVEATGVTEAVDRVEKKLLEHRRLHDDAIGRGPEGQPLYFTKENVTEKFPHEAKKIEMFEALDKTYTDEQLKEMNRTGYTIMSHQQLELVYGNGSVGEDLKFLEYSKTLTRGEVDQKIMRTVRDLAKEKVKFEARKKDIVLSPVTFTNFIFDPVSVSQPTILSPVMLCSLIGSPAIYGVMIMSPWLMVPVVLSPRIFSPVVLNPFLMVPIIISPLAFNPFILCPGSMNPFVLSPLVLSPFILSPQVMTPLILTPFCLGPIILNPLALSPLVLSPFVLSPTILSPQYVTAVILSPYALSPAWGSDGAMVTVFASPSWLS